ncbi:MAG: permease [Arcobacter sp.]|nr:MAG: permease [Arcobacter sp.]
MKLLKKYLLLNYSETFFPIFLTLYTITSIVFLVKIASLTSIIQIDFLELIELYGYSVPTILFYTLPISVFVALSLTLSKLSSEYELIVITSFGLNPIKIIKLILPTILLSSLLLLLLSLALIPKSSSMKKIFLENKKTEAQFNIKASEYGQAFGKWLIYVKKENKGVYKDIVLFQQDNKKDTFIIARNATMKNNGSSLSLNLDEGKALNITNKMNQIDFKKMIINNELQSAPSINNIDDLILYWKDMFTQKSKAKNFSFSVLSSLFPLLSIFFIIYIGYYNPRYQKNNSTILAIACATIFLIISHRLSKEFGLITLVYIPVIWFIISLIIYHFKIKPHY